MKSHEIPNRPWSKVSADIFQLAGSNYLVMVDHYSDFFELDSLRNTTASTVIRAGMKKELRSTRNSRRMNNRQQPTV